MALSGPLQGSNCCAFPPAKLQPSLVDGSAAGIFHRAEVGGWTCAPLSDVSCLWLVRSSHACRPRREVCHFLPSAWFCCKSIDFGVTQQHSFPVNARLFPSSSVPKFRSRKRDTSFRGNLGMFQLRPDSARVASSFVTVDFYFRLSSAPASWSSLSALQPRPEKRERQRPCKLLVAYCRRDEWVALISPGGALASSHPD